MTNLLGLLGSVFLALCGLPELVSSVRKGYCGASAGLLILWQTGEVATFAYVALTSKDPFLLFNYSANILLILALMYYKSKPMRPEKIKELHNFLNLKDSNE